MLDAVGNTYLETGNYTNGFVVVNGHNLGRYWKKRSQKRLYCPAPWLLKGENEVVVFNKEVITVSPITDFTILQ